MIDSSDPYIYISFHFQFISTLFLEQMYRTKEKKKKKKKRLFNYSLKISQSTNFIHNFILRPVRCCYDVDERHRFPEIRQHEEGEGRKKGSERKEERVGKSQQPSSGV